MSDAETVEVPATEIIGEVPPQPELTTEQQANRLNVEFHFPSGVYWINKPEFLETAKFVSKEYLNNVLVLLEYRNQSSEHQNHVHVLR